MSRVQLAVLGKRVASASLTTIQSQRRKKKKKRSHTGLASLYTQGREHVSSLRGSGASRCTDYRERAASALRATVIPSPLPSSIIITMSLLPPAEGSEYPDRKSMVEAIQAHAKSNGYAVTIQQSSNKDGTVYLRCDHGGQY